MAGMNHNQITIPQGAVYTVADVEFMQGMIAHHAQAIYMSRMAQAHGANPRVLRLATKIDQSQVAEIRIMQEWLTRNGQAAPDTSSWRSMHMPGMLTMAQLDSLDATTGATFDRAYLRLMIQHHEGALQMVKDLLATPGTAQDVDVSVFANDVVSVQIIYNIFRQRPAELFFREARARNVAVIVRVPLASGLLTGKMSRDTRFAQDDHRHFNRHGEAFDVGETFAGVPYEVGLEAVEAIRPLVPGGTTMAAFALRWILMADAVSVVIPGAKSRAQAQANVAASTLPPLSDETMQALRAIYQERIAPYVHHRW